MKYSAYRNKQATGKSKIEQRAARADDANVARLEAFLSTSIDVTVKKWGALIARLRSYSRHDWAQVKRLKAKAVPELAKK